MEEKWRSLKWWLGLGLLAVFIYVVVDFLVLPFIAIRAIMNEPPGTTALMRQRINESANQGKTLRVRQHWIPYKEIPVHVVNAVIVAEDGTFHAHGGFDWFEVKESIKKNIERRRVVRGASTITQQLAKNLFLSTSKNPLRKLKEMGITILLEWQLSKQRILELYLNVIEWGDGIFGIEAASREYFGKPAIALTREEGARLAAVIPSPLRNRPDRDTRYVLRRKNSILSRMKARQSTNTEEEIPSNQNPAHTSRPAGFNTVPDSTLQDTLDIDEDADDGLQRRQQVD